MHWGGLSSNEAMVKARSADRQRCLGGFKKGESALPALVGLPVLPFEPNLQAKDSVMDVVIFEASKPHSLPSGLWRLLEREPHVGA